LLFPDNIDVCFFVLLDDASIVVELKIFPPFVENCSSQKSCHPCPGDLCVSVGGDDRFIIVIVNVIIVVNVNVIVIVIVVNVNVIIIVVVVRLPSLLVVLCGG
jgi:hypothetical protein